MNEATEMGASVECDRKVGAVYVQPVSTRFLEVFGDA